MAENCSYFPNRQLIRVFGGSERRLLEFDPEFILYLKEASLIFLKTVLQNTLAVSSRILTIFWRLHHISLPSLEEEADFAKAEIVSTRSPSLFVFFVTKIPSWLLATASKVTQYVKELNHRTTKPISNQSLNI